MTDHTKKTTEENDARLEDEQLDEASGGTGYFTECSGIGSEHEPTTGKTIIGGFKSLSGMDSKTDVIEYQDGDDVTIRKRPGK